MTNWTALPLTKNKEYKNSQVRETGRTIQTFPRTIIRVRQQVEKTMILFDDN